MRAEMDQSASHLFVGTQAENLADMARKLRSGTAKLTPDDVRALRDRYAAGESLNALALSAGYAKRTVYMALTGETWAHVPGAIRLREPMRGSRHVRARLTEELVADLRRRYSAGESCKALATEIGVHYNTVEHAVSGRKWAHVPGAVALNHTRWTKPG